MKLQLLRTYDNGVQTEGVLYVIDSKGTIIFKCYTLELPYKNNQQRISCIEQGTYQVIKHNSPKFGKCFWLQSVPGRSEILIHRGNYYFDVLGCILVGDSLIDINKDGNLDVINSVKVMNKLLDLLPNKFLMEIKYRK